MKEVKPMNRLQGPLILDSKGYFLPPYSPEVNAIERVWKLIRKMRTHNRYFPSIGDLDHSLNEQFSTYRTQNDTLKRLCAIE